MDVSPFWHAFGTVSAAAFIAAIVLSFVARYCFESDNPRLVRFGAATLSLLGGFRTARQVEDELKRRAAK